MIHYSLVCDAAHEFDGWFRDSATFDAQASSGVVVCPYCHSTSIAKAVMAPHVARKFYSGASVEEKRQPSCARREDEGQEESRPVALLDERHAQLRAMIRELRESIVASTEDVGERFPSEARKIQDGDAEPRPIRGRASLAEAKSLLEDGIEILPFPGLPGEGN
ncbi:MAG: DUF1178 family protein [Methylocystis sp.]